MVTSAWASGTAGQAAGHQAHRPVGVAVAEAVPHGVLRAAVDRQQEDRAGKGQAAARQLAQVLDGVALATDHAAEVGVDHVQIAGGRMGGQEGRGFALQR
jgi:hypothetical protein